jgi:hypothetical protein
MDEPGTACQGLMKGGGVGGGFSIACAEGIDDGEGPEFEIDESMGLALISCCGVFEPMLSRLQSSVRQEDRPECWRIA